jgi:thiamine-monophosphate kinase
LVGGDTTRGPLSITVTAHGFIPRDVASRRSGAQVGDEVWISGTLGDAAAALRQWRAGQPIDPELRRRLDRPMPRVALGVALRGIVSACIDVSDGLLADLDHVLHASGVGAEIDRSKLPASPALSRLFDEAACSAMQLGGGDDYELCFTASPGHAQDVIAVAAHTDVDVRRIGRIEAQAGLRLRDDAGSVSDSSPMGYRHFDASRDEGTRA